jgi:hypothetical protein
MVKLSALDRISIATVHWTHIPLASIKFTIQFRMMRWNEATIFSNSIIYSDDPIAYPVLNTTILLRRGCTAT